MLTIGDTAPDFDADSTEGRIKFHEWIGDSWAVLFSHPRDFTPVCTTELGYMARIKPEFDNRGVKILGLSVDPTDNHAKWAADIEETQGTAPNYPLIADHDFEVSKAYGMLPPDTSGDPTERTPAQNATLRDRLSSLGQLSAVRRAPSESLPSSSRSRASTSSHLPVPSTSSKPATMPFCPWRTYSWWPPYGATTHGSPQWKPSTGASPRPSTRDSFSITWLFR